MITDDNWRWSLMFIDDRGDDHWSLKMMVLITDVHWLMMVIITDHWRWSLIIGDHSWWSILFTTLIIILRSPVFINNFTFKWDKGKKLVRFRNCIERSFICVQSRCGSFRHLQMRSFWREYVFVENAEKIKLVIIQKRHAILKPLSFLNCLSYWNEIGPRWKIFWCSL